MKKGLLLFILSVFFLLGCSNLNDSVTINDNSKKVEFSITLPGETQAKAVYSESDAKSYKIDIVKELKSVVSKTGKPGETIIFELSEEGKYTITVYAYDENGKEIAKGSVEKDFKFGFGVIPVKIKIEPYQKAIEIVPEIVWGQEPEKQMMKVEYSKEGNGIDITMQDPDEKYNSIRFIVYKGDNECNDFLCYMNNSVTYPVSFSYPFVEDGEEYRICYYCQTDGTKENREIYEEEYKVVAKGGIGEIIPKFDSTTHSITGTNNADFFVCADISYIGTGDEPSMYVNSPLILSQIGLVEVGKGTKDWGPLTVYKGGMTFDLETLTSLTKSLSVSGISAGDTYFVQSMTEYILADEEKYPYKIRTVGIQSENLTWIDYEYNGVDWSDLTDLSVIRGKKFISPEAYNQTSDYDMYYAVKISDNASGYNGSYSGTLYDYSRKTGIATDWESIKAAKMADSTTDLEFDDANYKMISWPKSETAPDYVRSMGCKISEDKATILFRVEGKYYSGVLVQ